jgi:hypothetical protein
LKGGNRKNCYTGRRAYPRFYAFASQREVA